MPFVKIDCGILDSSLWLDRDARDLFWTALLMAVPKELAEPAPQLAIRSLETTGWTVPAGWYGIVEAAGTGIVRREGTIAIEAGLLALERLGAPDPESRSDAYAGRRLARINGGFVVLNYMEYREYDYTHAERQRRYRERHVTPSQPSRDTVTTPSRDASRCRVRTDPPVRTADPVRTNPAEVPQPANRAVENRPTGTGGRISHEAIETFRLTWNRILVAPVPPWSSLTKSRRAAIRAALTWRDQDFWTALFERIAQTPFLLGENRDQWTASLDWLIGKKFPENPTKILEGKYNERPIPEGRLRAAKTEMFRALGRMATDDEARAFIRKSSLARTG